MPKKPLTETDPDKLPKVYHFITRSVLAGPAGNAFALLGRFDHLAEQAGWPEAARKQVCEAAMKGNYSQLLATLEKYMRPRRGAKRAT